MTNIMLCMIVRDEERTLPRCLDAAIPIIDAACICDTGSEDETVEIAAEALDKAGKPHRILEHRWQNFGANRTRSFEAARSFARDLGWDLDHSYALLLDADMVLRVPPDFDAASLSAAGYSVPQYQGSLFYQNIRLARLDLDWRCIGATHEYWSLADGEESAEPCMELAIDDIGDGGSKRDKNERDRKLLEAELQEQPDNTRTLFYLAQTHFDAERYEAAYELYQRRAQAGGWEEEAWYAAYRAGLCSIHLGEWERGAGELLSAWDRRPQRAEPLYMLAHHARKHKAPHTAMMAAERAVKIPFPPEERLFVDQRAYRDGPIEEISISSYYTGDQERGAAACDALLHHRATASTVRTLAARNSAYYAEPLAHGAQTRRVNIPGELLDMTFSPSTGSIHQTAKGYALINRLVSYYQHTAATFFIPRDPDGKYYTRNAWVEFDRDLKPRRASLIDDALVEQQAVIPASKANICGLEDVRLIRWNDAWWFTGGSSQYDAQHRPRLVLGRLADDRPAIEYLVRLRYDGEQMYEKNWVPFIRDGRLLLLYSCDPLVVLEPDPTTGACKVIARALPPVDLSRYRGSSQLVRAGSRYLATVHEAAPSDHGRFYLHRFIEMDDDYRITRASRPFTFLHRGVEYCCGMCLSHAGDELVISFSWEERESWLVKLPLDRVEAMLMPIEELAYLDPPPDARSAGPGWFDLARAGKAPLAGAADRLNGSERSGRRARPRLRRSPARRRLQQSGRG